MNEVVLRYGNTDLNIYDGYDLTKSSQEVTYSDLTCEFTGHSVEELPERYQEAKIIEKQKVNQEVETIQYEEKNKIKEATFDSEINENLVVDKVHGSTSQETREESKSVLTGSEIVVNDTYIDNKTQFIIDGNSEQNTYEGYNLCNIPNQTINGVTIINSNNGLILNGTCSSTFSIVALKQKVEAGDYIIKNLGDGASNATYQSVIYKNNNIVAYVTKKNKSITFENDDEIRLKLYIYSGTVFNNLILPVQVCKDNDRPYEPYTGGILSPNPDYPQEIEVIDGCNLFDFNKQYSSIYKANVNVVDKNTFAVTSTYLEANDAATYILDVKKNMNYCLNGEIINGNFARVGIQYRIDSSSNWVNYATVFTGVGEFNYNISTNSYSQIRLLFYSQYDKVTEVQNTIFKCVQLTEGLTIRPYLPYGNIGLEQSGKNKLNVTAVSKTFTEGITVTVNEDKSITINGTNNSSSTLYFRLADNFVLPAGSYTLSNENSNVSNDKFIFYDDANNFPRKNISNATFTEDVTIKPYIKILYGATVNNQTIYPMIVKGTYSETTLPEYEPYHEPKTISIDLQGNELAKVGDIKDKLKIYRNGEVEIEKNIGKITTNIQDTFTLSEGALASAVYPTNRKSSGSGLCNRAIQKGHSINSIDYFYSNPANFVFVGDQNDTEESFKEKYNGAELYYQITSPQIIKLSNITPITTWEGTNIFKLISNLDTTIELTYNYISAMPSTETPSQINNTESINIKIQNESLFDIKELVKMSDNYSEVENGYIFSSKHDMYSDGVPLTTPITLPASLSYTIKNGTGTNFRFKFVYDDGSATSFTKYISGTEADVTKNIVINNITKSGASKIVKICIDYSTAGTFTITNFMINEGTTTKPYIKHKEQNISFSLDKPLYENCYLAEDGIHYNRTQSVVNITSAVKLSNGNVAGVYDPPNKTSKQNNLLICSKAKFERTYKTNTVYENPSSVVFVGEETDTLEKLKQKFDGAILEYELKNEIIVPYTEKQKRNWKKLQKLISYTGKNYVESTTDIDIKCPTKIKKEIIPKIYEKLLFTGYVDDYSFNEMREKDVDIDINITLYSPMKMTTLRTATAVGTYELKSLIQKEILSPLIDDGFSIEELDITNRQLTVNYISETIEYCMNNLSNKFNFWWFIDEQKRIYIKDIDKLMNGEPDYIYDDTHSIAGLQYIKPITESDNYANVVNFKNVRIYEYSRLQLNGNTITQEHNPLISQQITTIKNGEQLDFNFPCDIKKENIIKSAESNGITQYFYGIYVKGTYSDNTTFEFSIGYDDINKTFETTGNVGFDGSENATEEFLLIRDSFFSNLITGFKLNNESKNIKSIEKITSDSVLIWNVNKLYNDKAIADKRGIISNTGIVETTIDMNESWKTIQELREIGISYMNKNSLDLNGTIELCTDRNVFEVGKTIYINKMLVNGTYIVTQIKESLSNNDIDYYITAKNANMLDNYIDVFRGEASQESSDKTYQIYITHYEEENMYEKHEVVQ